MVLNESMQILREAEELKQKILKFQNGISMLQEKNLWVMQQQLQKLYQRVLVLDLDYALDKKVEQDLWNIGFKQQIEALQAISKDRKNPRRSDGQQMLSWMLQSATGFYLCLLHQISTAFKLDLPFRRRASLLGLVECWGAGGEDVRYPVAAAAMYICQHCLVHLGDLARYRQQLRVAYSFYRQALLVSAHSGQPYNQLALVSWRRGRRLGALYWHVRSLLVRAPFPPAPANLERTLAAAAQASQNEELPVLPGITEKKPLTPVAKALPTRLTSHDYVTLLIRAYHLIHTMDDLDTAALLVNKLNSSLTALVSTDSFEPMTLVKMACVTMWLAGGATEELRVSRETLTESEGAAAELGVSLAAGMVVSLLLCSHTHAAPGLPALKVLLEWIAVNPALLSESAVTSRPQLWPALALTLNSLAEEIKHFDSSKYETVPLPEDEELHGFLPLEPALKGLKLSKYASWDTYGDQVPTFHIAPGTSTNDSLEGEERDKRCLSLCQRPQLAGELRASRLLALARRLSDGCCSQFLLYSTTDGLTRFTAPQTTPELTRALEELSLVSDAEVEGGKADERDDSEEDSDDEFRPPPPPVVISEADFREKVREKRVGILKPQGSLERAREERALIAATQDGAQDECGASESVASEELTRSVSARTRTNVALQAILRVQEESNKQVKFVTPSATPDSTTDPVETSPAKDSEKTKIFQPKAIKSLANIPVGKKTGGILSLKDKSAGYPHLVNTEPEPPKKPDECKKSEAAQTKSAQGPTHNSQQSQHHPPNYSNKPRMEQPHSGQPWSPGINKTPLQPYNEPPRMSYSHQKAYNQQTAAGFSSPYNQQNQINLQNQGIRLPVVNPKEIDVRTAALQKQYSRHDFLQDVPKFGNQNWQVSGDKKAFLNDLPPRFANQFRNWSTQEQQYGSADGQEKYREDSFKSSVMFGNTNQPNFEPNWANSSLPAENQQAAYNWWGADNSSNFTNFNPPMNPQPSYYQQLPPNPYQIPNYNPISNQQQSFQQKPIENRLSNIGSSFMQTGLTQPQSQSLQNSVKSPNYNTALSSFGNYGQNLSYDSSMYPQFSNNKLGYQPAANKMPDKPLGPYGQQSNPMMDMRHGLGMSSGGMSEMHPQSLVNVDLMGGVLINENLDILKGLDQMGASDSGAEGASTYSLFSGGAGGAGAGWGASSHLSAQAQHPQSLWSGPGPSPLERLLEQQKQLNKTGGEQ